MSRSYLAKAENVCRFSSGGDEIRIRRLEPRDDRSGFRSGNIDLDRFFQRYAGQNQFRHHIGCVGVVVDAKPDAIDFYTTLGFTPMRLVSGTLGDRPEPIAMFLPIGQIAAAAGREPD